AIQKIASHRYFPVLAHPERYNFINQNSSKFSKFKKTGIQLQMNILSLGEYYGKDVQKKAHKLLSGGLIDYLASDIHNLQQLEYLKEIQVTDNHLKLLLPVIDRTIGDFG
ncbi:MAG TPA: CpsB/CapC family capsule biosynthesis tyrosine phosphatase, partial [Arenibacter sp.]|nr:CpsB/CapC family capsule biosynthesis tyrosine phosphatase [Arenibacter sp.]